MTPQEFAAKVKSNRDILARAVPSMCQEIAESTLALIKDRSINEGININGTAQKATYSKNPISTEKFRKKVLNKGGSSWLDANAFGTWHQFRKAQGLQSEPVNLSYTNDMWENIKVLTTQQNGDGKAQTVVGSYDDETNKKISGNEFLFGDFLTPIPDELQLAQEVLQEKILKLLRQ